MSNGVEDVLKPFEHSVQQLYNTRMLTSGRKSQYGVKIKFRESVGSFFGVMLEPFERPPHNFVFASNICPTSVQLLLNEC